MGGSIEQIDRCNRKCHKRQQYSQRWFQPDLVAGNGNRVGALPHFYLVIHDLWGWQCHILQARTNVPAGRQSIPLHHLH